MVCAFGVFAVKKFANPFCIRSQGAEDSYQGASFKISLSIVFFPMNRRHPFCMGFMA